MATRPKRARTPGFDRLDRRDLPGGAGLAAACTAGATPIAAAAGSTVSVQATRKLVLNGTARGRTTAATPQPDGGALLDGTLSGRLGTLGRFTGTLATQFAPGLRNFTGTAHLIGAGGETVDLAISGKLTGAQSKLRATFVIVGGTGRFAGATGGGSIASTNGLTSGAFNLQIKGTARV